MILFPPQKLKEHSLDKSEEFQSQQLSMVLYFWNQLHPSCLARRGNSAFWDQCIHFIYTSTVPYSTKKKQKKNNNHNNRIKLVFAD